MSNALSESATKLLNLIEKNHQGMHFISAGGDTEGRAFVQVLIPVDEMNKIAEGMSVLASLVQLNPAYVVNTAGERKHA